MLQCLIKGAIYKESPKKDVTALGKRGMGEKKALEGKGEGEKCKRP